MSAAGRLCRDCGTPLGPRATGAVCPRCALRHAVAPTPDPAGERAGTERTGRRFGEYELHQEIGRGGMGVIYRARQPRLNRWVALKVLAGGEFASLDFKQRFRRETEAAAALDHPNIVPIYEVGEEDGQPYFSMRLVEGPTLGSWRLPASGAARLRRCAAAIATLARAVQYAHERGVLHRDLKPNNVLVDGAGHLFLTDFGLARLLEKDSSLTRTLAVLGTPSYMAPEQARGETGQLTTAADVYGLGAILYELLAGRPPFTGSSSIEILRQVLESEPVPPSRAASEVAGGRRRSESGIRDLDTVCLKCLEKEPRRRYPSAAALASDLDRWLNHEPIRARQVSTLERVRKWVRRKPAWAALILTLGISLVGVTLGWAWFTVQVLQARNAAEQANRELSRNLFVREWQEAEALVAQDKTHGALRWFARAVRDQGGDAAPATRLLSLLSEHAFAVPAQAPITNGAPVRSISFSTDDTRLLTSDAAGWVRCWSVADGQPQFVLPKPFDLLGAMTVAGDSRILVVDRSAVSLWPSDGGSELLREVGSQHLSTFDLSADGRRLALGWGDGRAEVWDAATLEPVSVCALGDGENPNFLRLSRDGRLLLRNRRRELRVFDSETGRLLWRAQPPLPAADWYYARGDFSADNRFLVATHMAGVARGWLVRWSLEAASGVIGEPVLEEQPAWSVPALAETSGILVSRDSSRALVWARSGLLQCYSTQDGARVTEPLEHAGAVVSVAEAGSTAWVATASERVVQFWDLGARTSQPRVVANAAPLGDARFGPDGTWVALGEMGRVSIVQTSDGSVRRVLPMPGPVAHVVVSADGRRLAASAAHTNVLVWNPETGELLSRMPTSPTPLGHLSLSPDGRRYAVALALRPVVQVYDTESGQAACEPLTHDAAVVNTLFSPDGNHLAVPTTSGDTALWELPLTPSHARRLPVSARHDAVVWMAQFSPDGKRLVTASSDRTARVWDLDSGKLVREVRHHKPVYLARFSPDGARLLTGSGDQTARLWHVTDGRPLGEPMLHPGGVWYGEFSADGRIVLSGDDTGHARIWDAGSGLPLNGWVAQGASLKCARLTSDARHALAGSLEQGVRLWNPLIAPSAAPVWLADLAEAVAGTRLGNQGTVEPVAIHRLSELRAALTSAPASDYYARWARWFLLDRREPEPPASP